MASAILGAIAGAGAGPAAGYVPGVPGRGINALARRLGPTPKLPKPHSDARNRAKAMLGIRLPSPLGPGRIGSTRSTSDLFRRLPRLPR